MLTSPWFNRGIRIPEEIGFPFFSFSFEPSIYSKCSYTSKMASAPLIHARCAYSPRFSSCNRSNYCTPSSTTSSSSSYSSSSSSSSSSSCSSSSSSFNHGHGLSLSSGNCNFSFSFVSLFLFRISASGFLNFVPFLYVFEFFIIWMACLQFVCN